MKLAKGNACRNKVNLKNHLLTSLLKCDCVCVICLKGTAVKKINGKLLATTFYLSGVRKWEEPRIYR